MLNSKPSGEQATAIKSRWTSFLWIIALLVIAGLVIVRILTLTPAGKYRIDKMGTGGLAYFEFTDGSVFEVIHSKYDVSSPVVQRVRIGSYQKRGDRWVAIGDNGLTSYLDVSLFGIRFVDASGKTELGGGFPRLFSFGSFVLPNP